MFLLPRVYFITTKSILFISRWVRSYSFVNILYLISFPKCGDQLIHYTFKRFKWIKSVVKLLLLKLWYKHFHIKNSTIIFKKSCMFIIDYTQLFFNIFYRIKKGRREERKYTITYHMWQVKCSRISKRWLNLRWFNCDLHGLHLFWFRKVARMRVNLAGKKQGEHNSCQTKPSFSDDEGLGESQNII